ncbi:MAG TPA: hypothetical protein DCM62_10175 [Bacteroidales bacterium]|nr:hypothetical protein [Bacteroidales bacterium]
MSYNKKPENGKDTRFKPGISGNPKGRAKGKRTLSSVLKEFMQLEVVTEVEGIPIEQEVQYIIAKALIEKAMKGDIRAISEIFDRIEGKPKQAAMQESEGIVINIVPRRSENTQESENQS